MIPTQSRLRLFWRTLLARVTGLWGVTAFSAAIFLAVVAIFLAGQLGLLPDLREGLQAQILHLARGPYLILGLFGVFFVGALIGVPQFALIGTLILILGPLQGASLAWLATLFSALATFAIGKWAGTPAIRHWREREANPMARFINQNAFFSIILIRNLPAAPFLIVNLALGALNVRFWVFGLATAIGILPKIIFLAAIGTGARQVVNGALVSGIVLAAFGCVIWLGVRLWRSRALAKPLVD